MSRKDYPDTPDGRYFVAKSRLWRKTDPRLDDNSRRSAVKCLMKARREVGQANTEEETRTARERVDTAKRELGERGPVWWEDGAPDETGKAPWNSSYADWWSHLSEDEQEKGR